MGKRQRLKKALKEQQRELEQLEFNRRRREKRKRTSKVVFQGLVIGMIGIILVGGGIWTYQYFKHRKNKSIVSSPSPSPSTSATKLSETKKMAEIITSKGKIKFIFYPEVAPKTVENFQLLALKKYYDGTTFHRVEPGFVIQGGDPNSRDDDPANDGQGGESAWGGKFDDEIDSNNPIYQKGYLKGTVAMANSGPNTNGSQFFICLEDQSSLPKSYTIFGQVVEGMEVVEKITKGDQIEQVILLDQ
jgi:peptidylprolyl isomerase/peptidyl-prolyl cis-trans isomerase-like 1